MWGIVSQFEKNQALLLLKANSNLLDKKNFQLNVGISGVVKNYTKNSFLHEVFMNTKIYDCIDFSLGKHAYSPLSYNDTIMVGGFMRNSNARPFPRAQIGIFNYYPLYIINDFISIKGGLSHGILNDNRTAEGRSNSADNVHVHEKWTYLKFNFLKVQPYIGLYHGALLGGKRPNGSKIPIDYWATFFAQGSNKIGGGEATNAAGGHDGFWDFGFYFNNNFAKLHVYMQKPYSDGSGLILYNRTNHDYKIGVLIGLKDLKLISSISFEIFKTNYQSGCGLPDPIYPTGHPKAGQYFILNEVDDFDAFMLDVFGLSQEGGFTRQEVRDFLKIQNHNKGYSGRDDYNNNGMYFNGWTYFNQTMGFPLYHTVWQVKSYAPNWQPNGYLAFINNRVKGFHIGFDGFFRNQFYYLFKTTYTINLGAYSEKYINRYSWTEDEDFFYKGGKKQVYSNLKLSYSNRTNFYKVDTSISYDFGELYHSLGIMLGLSIFIK